MKLNSRINNELPIFKGARLILISVGASMWPQETLVACLLIGIAWFVWLHQTADARYAFCLKKTEPYGDVFCSCVVAVIYPDFC